MRSNIEIENPTYIIDPLNENQFPLSQNKKILKNLQSEEVLVEHEFIGVNYFDLDIIKNYKKNQRANPEIFRNSVFVPGIEAIGKIKAFGENVTNFSLNERVMYSTKRTGGAYAKYNIVNHNLLIAPPKEIKPKEALAIGSRGIIAHTLLKKVYISYPGETNILITNPLGALGHIVAQFAKFFNLNIIAAVQDDESGRKKELCEKLRYFDLVINLDEKSTFHDQIMYFTNGFGVNLIIDTIGGENLKKLLSSMLYCGIFISLGQNSGQDLLVNLRLLQNKSIFLTRPSIFDYKACPNELRLTAYEVFQLYLQDFIKPKINKTYDFNSLESLFEDVQKRKLKFFNIIKV